MRGAAFVCVVVLGAYCAISAVSVVFGVSAVSRAEFRAEKRLHEANEGIGRVE